MCSLGFCLSSNAISPTTSLEELHFTNWGTGSGLPHNAVRRVLQTADHYLWIATNDGVVRFDGATMRNFTPDFPVALAHSFFS